MKMIRFNFGSDTFLYASYKQTAWFRPPGYSSLLYIELSDPLSDAIVCTEGPAHLMMDRSEGRFEQLRKPFASFD